MLTGTPPAIGLPSAANNRTISTVLTSGNTVNYAFNDYGANNVIEFEAAATGTKTLTLATPQGLSQIALAFSGLLNITGFPDRPPVRFGTALADYATALTGAIIYSA